MEKAINQLFEIEDTANRIIKRAHEEKARLFEEFEKSVVEMEEKIAFDNTTRLKALQQQADKELTAEKEVLIANSTRQLKELESIDKNKHDALVNQVFENIIRS